MPTFLCRFGFVQSISTTPLRGTRADLGRRAGMVFRRLQPRSREALAGFFIQLSACLLLFVGAIAGIVLMHR